MHAYPAYHPTLETLEGRTVPATLDLTGYASPVNVALSTSDATGFSGSYSGGASGTFSGVDNLIGNGGSLTGRDVGSLFAVNAANAGSYADGTATLSFSGTHALTGGMGNDTFGMAAAGSVLAGAIDGGGGRNRLDWTGTRTAAVVVNLPAGTASALGGLANVQDVTGGSGNDVLFGDDSGNALDGGGGSDILVGNGGDDALTGGDGRDLLIGGQGADSLDGGSGDDILVGGVTTYDTNLTALSAIRNEWTRAGATYAQRVGRISGTLGGGLNGAYRLNASTVSDDSGAADSLTGGSGQDWFLTSSGDAVPDLDALTEIQTSI